MFFNAGLSINCACLLKQSCIAESLGAASEAAKGVRVMTKAAAKSKAFMVTPLAIDRSILSPAARLTQSSTIASSKNSNCCTALLHVRNDVILAPLHELEIDLFVDGDLVEQLLVLDGEVHRHRRQAEALHRLMRDGHLALGGVDLLHDAGGLVHSALGGLFFHLHVHILHLPECGSREARGE